MKKAPSKQEIYDAAMSADIPAENKADRIYSEITNLIKAGEDGDYDSLQDEELEARTWELRAKRELGLLG